MNNPIGDLSFGCKTCHDFLAGLREVVAEYEQDPLNARLAITSALWAWHMHDWVFTNHKSSLKCRGGGPPSVAEDYGKWLTSNVKEKESFEVIQLVANGSKHCKLTKGKRPPDAKSLQRGGFDPRAFDDGFDVARLQFQMNGKIYDFLPALLEVREFWEVLLPKLK